MLFLVVTVILWAFSFSLIDEYLAGQVDSWFSVLMRLGLAGLVFSPFLRWRNFKKRVVLFYMVVGACQLGLMYLFSFHAYIYLTVSEFLLFTVTTPFYVTLLYDLLSRQRLRWGYIFSALLAVVGSVIIYYGQLSEHFWFGLMLVQFANLCFAIGLVGYKWLMERYPMPLNITFSWFFLGAFCVALTAWLLFGDVNKLPTTQLQWGVLLWLGIGATALGYLMWNYGATQVDAGTLAIMNNIRIPAGLLVNLVIWQEQLHWSSFIVGSTIIMIALWVHRNWIVQLQVQKAGCCKRAVGLTE